MADITPRNLRFDFAPLDLDVPDEALGGVLRALGLSLTMPYLEPYLIRTMKVALRELDDPVLAEDARRFSQQEGHHFRNHAALNEHVRGHFDGATAADLRSLEADLEADYQRFSKERPLRWNLAYAEGFEAMTCAAALAAAEHRAFEGPGMPGGEIWPWHMAEEIEHRTVAFKVYDHLVGSYFYRIAFGAWAQRHYLSYVGRFAARMAEGLGRQPGRARLGPMERSALRNYARTLGPWYDPAKIAMPAGVRELLDRYSGMLEPRGAPAPPAAATSIGMPVMKA